MIGPIAVVAATTSAALSMALLEVSPSKLTRTERGQKLRRRLELVERDYGALAGGILVASLLVLGAFCLRLYPRSPVLAIAIPPLTVLAAGTARSLAERGAESLLLALDPLLSAMRRLLRYPFLWALHRVTDWLSDRLAGPEPESDDEDPNEELLTAVRDSLPEADLDEDESYWIGNIVALAHRNARAAMTPRTDVFAFEADLGVREAIRQAVQRGYSRYPVFEGTIDQVLGVFYAKDLLELIGVDQFDEQRTVRQHLREPLFVNDSEGLAEVLQLFRRKKRHMAIVRDEYGGTCGVITIEDILEEIVGDIEDEYDDAGHRTIRVLESGLAIEVDGRVRIDEVNEHLGNKIPESPDYETVAGWVFTSLERIPETGESFDLGPARLQILLADSQRIRRLSIRLLRPDDVPPTVAAELPSS